MSITGIHTCPSCQMAVTFRSTHTNMITCSFCKVRLEKAADGVLKQRNDIAAMHDDSSSLQVGSKGRWNEQGFELIGRMRFVFDEEHTNYWTILMEDGTVSILAESYGHYAICERAFPENKPFSKLTGLDYSSGLVELLPGKQFLLERKDTVLSMEVEGEVWLFIDELQFQVLELASLDGERVVVMGRVNKTYICFTAHYQKAPDFWFEQVRVEPIPKIVRCNDCGNEISLYSFPLSVSFACDKCGSCYDFKSGKPNFVRRLSLARKPDLPLYAEGNLKNLRYKVVGFMDKADENDYHWREYTLYNKVYGYAFLSEYNGHWIFLQERIDAPVMPRVSRVEFLFEDHLFEAYNTYTYKITDAQGEFPGNVFNDKSVQCSEYISPPQMWSRERHPEGLTWFHGQHITPKEIYTGFEGVVLPSQIGMGVVQPVPFSASRDAMRIGLMVTSVALLFLFMTSMMFNQTKVVYDNTIFFTDSANGLVVTPPFTLDKWRSNLELTVEAPVSNNWFEAGFTLVNADNGNEYQTEKGVEYYSGYTDGESWTEGSTKGDVLLPLIPGGKYFLQIQPAYEEGKRPDFFHVLVTYDVPMWRNFWVIAALALVPLGGLFAYTTTREASRWMNSPYSSQNSNYDQ